MEAIKDTIISVIRGLEAKKTGVAEQYPQEVLKKVLTKKELGHIKFNYFRKGILGLCVDSSSWLYSFNLKKEDLLGKFKKHLQGVKNIRFNIGE